VSVTVDLPVGIVTTLMGVPFFLFLLHRARVGRG
jgi:ABC-type Fe3+-siderophore transport system permease subunit